MKNNLYVQNPFLTKKIVRLF